MFQIKKNKKMYAPAYPSCAIEKLGIRGYTSQGHVHGGDSIDTTCAVVRDVTAYIAVVQVFRFSSGYYGCRYTNSTHVKAARDCI